jgi:hypothetical protein
MYPETGGKMKKSYFLPITLCSLLSFCGDVVAAQALRGVVTQKKQE